MIRQMPSLDVLKHELRRRVCPRCYRRPLHSETTGAENPRHCEEHCPIFLHLPLLKEVAVQLDPMLCSRRQVLGHRIDDTCWREGAGETPLSRYRRQVVETILDAVGEE
jgi:hypothetical protein